MRPTKNYICWSHCQQGIKSLFLFILNKTTNSDQQETNNNQQRTILYLLYISLIIIYLSYISFEILFGLLVCWSVGRCCCKDFVSKSQNIALILFFKNKGGAGEK